jgi:hypothetical protein
MRERKWGQCVTKRRKERKKTNGLASLASRSRTFRTLLSSDTLLSGLAGRRELSGLLSGAPGGTSSSRAADGSGLGDLDVDLAARDLGLVELGDGLDGVVLGGVGHETVAVRRWLEISRRRRNEGEKGKRTRATWYHGG